MTRGVQFSLMESSVGDGGGAGGSVPQSRSGARTDGDLPSSVRGSALWALASRQQAREQEEGDEDGMGGFTDSEVTRSTG